MSRMRSTVDADPVDVPAPPIPEAIEKAFLLDENNQVITPSGGLTADLKTAEGASLSAGNPDALAASQLPAELWKAPEDARYLSDAGWERIKRGLRSRFPASLALAEGVLAMALGDLVERSLDSSVDSAIVKYSELFPGAELTQMAVDEPSLVDFTLHEFFECYEEVHAGAVARAPRRTMPRRREQPVQKSARPPGPSPDLSGFVDKLEEIADRLSDKLDEIADRPQDISVTVQLDEARLAQAMKPKGDVEFLARTATGDPALMRRADGTVVKFNYGPTGLVESITPVENVEAELFWLRHAAAKAAATDPAIPYRELAKSDDPELAASARRVLASKGQI